MSKSLFEIFKNKRVLVTGHTGFKGSWLSLWLASLGADVTGYSAYIPSKPSNFEACGLKKLMSHTTGDVRNLKALMKVFKTCRPEVVFHLAAQPLVRKSYEDPKLTFDTNAGGTVNVLECIRTTPGVKAAVLITSDKCYRNMEWERGYRETDILGGDDPYSASKGCAEIIYNSYLKSFFASNTGARIASVRAGNVIGGGDWADDRIVPDCIKSFSYGREVIVRNPHATRPWQHVLEPLSGYLCLASQLLKSGELHGESFNFGPGKNVNKSVGELIDILISFWGDNASWKHVPNKDNRKESTLLKLSCQKAFKKLQWCAALSFKDTIRYTAQWYKTYYSGTRDMHNFSLKQIESYTAEALEKNIAWAKGK